MWYVLEGHFRFRADEEILDAPADSFVFVPRGTAHCFQNIGGEPARILLTFPRARPIRMRTAPSLEAAGWRSWANRWRCRIRSEGRGSQARDRGGALLLPREDHAGPHHDDAHRGVRSVEPFAERWVSQSSSSRKVTL